MTTKHISNHPGLKSAIESERTNVAALKKQLADAQDHLSALETDLYEIELAEFLTENNATHLQVDTRLAVSESFYQLMEERRYSRFQTHMWYGKEIAISSIDTASGEFRVRNVYESGMSCSSIGRIPLNVIQDMYQAYISKVS